VHQQPGIVIVGAGIIGLATAYALLKQGMQRVTVLEQSTVDHQHSPSRGLSRLLRFEYGADAYYPEMVELSLQRWQQLAQSTARRLYTPTEVLTLGREGDNFTQASYATLHALGLPIRSLSRHTCKRLFPQFNTQSHTLFLYNTEAAILYASSCLQTLRDLVLDLGGTIYESTQVTSLYHDNPYKPIQLSCADGRTIAAERVVLAPGSWVHRLLHTLHLPIRITRQYLLYFAHLPSSSFGLHAFPAFLADDLYGFPIHSTHAVNGPDWLKVASHSFGASIDPDDEPILDKRTIEHIAAKVQHLLPALRSASLAQVEACMYDVCADEDFILDYLPDDSRIVFAAGLTGHGFKFAPLLGEMLASLLCRTQPIVPLERFRLARFARQKQHSSVA
jgi:monomeric sarcosine oxidase